MVDVDFAKRVNFFLSFIFFPFLFWFSFFFFFLFSPTCTSSFEAKRQERILRWDVGHKSSVRGREIFNDEVSPGGLSSRVVFGLTARRILPKVKNATPDANVSLSWYPVFFRNEAFRRYHDEERRCRFKQDAGTRSEWPTTFRMRAVLPPPNRPRPSTTLLGRKKR